MKSPLSELAYALFVFGILLFMVASLFGQPPQSVAPPWELSPVKVVSYRLPANRTAPVCLTCGYSCSCGPNCPCDDQQVETPVTFTQNVTTYGTPRGQVIQGVSAPTPSVQTLWTPSMPLSIAPTPFYPSPAAPVFYSSAPIYRPISRPIVSPVPVTTGTVCGPYGCGVPSTPSVVGTGWGPSTYGSGGGGCANGQCGSVSGGLLRSGPLRRR